MTSEFFGSAVLTELLIGVRTYNAIARDEDDPDSVLRARGYTLNTVEDVRRVPDQVWLLLRGFGRHCLRDLHQALAEQPTAVHELILACLP